MLMEVVFILFCIGCIVQLFGSLRNVSNVTDELAAHAIIKTVVAFCRGESYSYWEDTNFVQRLLSAVVFFQHAKSLLQKAVEMKREPVTSR